MFKAPKSIELLSKIGFILKQHNHTQSLSSKTESLEKISMLTKKLLWQIEAKETPLELKIMLGCLECGGKPDPQAVLLVAALVALALLNPNDGKPVSYVVQMASMGIPERMFQIRLKLSEFKLAGFIEIDFCEQVQLRKGLLADLFNLPHWFSLDMENTQPKRNHPFFEED